MCFMCFLVKQHAALGLREQVQLTDGFAVSPGSAEALVRRGGKIKYRLIACFLSNRLCQTLSKSIHVCQSYSKTKVATFFETWCRELNIV